MIVTGTQEKKILAQAREERWAIGAFNAFDINTADAILTAAEELGVPAMMQLWDFHDPEAPEGNSMLNAAATKALVTMITARAAASPVPVILHLDHTRTFGGCIRGIQNGATSVMIDASQAPMDENIALTKRVIEAAHACDVLVEAEIGHVASNNDLNNSAYTSVEDAKRFYEETNTDLLAVSIGTAHGFYATEPVLNYERIAEIREAIPVPLVMHGASGLTDEQFKKCIENGIVKINFATYVQIEGGKAMVAALDKMNEAGRRPTFNGLVGMGQKAAKDYIKHHMELFGTRPVTL